ncbi:MAG: HNH endonuclease, partial [Ignavibacteria bacterium]
MLVYFFKKYYFYDSKLYNLQRNLSYLKEQDDFEHHNKYFVNRSNGRLNGKVLVLNQNYEAMSICNIQRAVILLYLGKAELISSKNSKYLYSVSRRMPFPTIVRLRIYIRVPYKKIVLSRKNILRRDLYKCQYCHRGETPLT